MLATSVLEESRKTDKIIIWVKEKRSVIDDNTVAVGYRTAQTCALRGIGLI